MLKRGLFLLILVALILPVVTAQNVGVNIGEPLSLRDGVSIGVVTGDVLVTNVNSSQFWRNLGTPEDIPLNDLGDVDAPAPNLGEVLTFNLTDWIPKSINAIAGSNGTINNTDICYTNITNIFTEDQLIDANLNVTGNISVNVVNDDSIFAMLSSGLDQIPLDTNPTVITYDIQDGISRINHSTSINPGEITIEVTGLYFISPQAQVGKDQGGGKIDFDMFLQVNRNGTFVDEPNSNIKLTIKDSDITDVIVSVLTLELEVGESIRIMQRASDTTVGMGLKNTNATANVPRTPSIIFTMYRIGG